MHRLPNRIKSSLLGLMAGIGLSACGSLAKIPTPEFTDWSTLFSNGWTDEEQAWADLLRNSSVKQVEKDRLIVEAWGAPRTKMDAVELRLLSRAAIETRDLGYKRFVIVHIADRNMPIAGGLNSISIFGADEYVIGSYEDLVRSRYERDYAAAPRAWINPGLTAIVLMLSTEDAQGYDETFDAVNLYEYLNRQGMAK